MTPDIKPLSSRYAPMPRGLGGNRLAIPMTYPMRSTFDARAIPGLAAWYDAADSSSVVLDGGRVSTWRDKSGNLRHATNTTSGSTQPSYTARGRNGLNVLSFAAASAQRLSVPSSTATFKFLHDGTPCWWIIASSYGNSNNPATFYVVFATNNGGRDAGMNYQFDDLPADGQNNGADIEVANGVGGVVSGYNSGFPASLKNIITPQTPTIQEALMDVGNATAANRATLRINGGTGITFNTYTGTPSTDNSSANFTIGAVSTGSFPMQGEMYEMLFFSQQPTSAARDLIRRYLGAKWGVTVG